jgi:hypothetical protein
MLFEVKPVEADGWSVQVLVDVCCRRRRRCGTVVAIVVVIPSQLVVRSQLGLIN